MTEVMDGTNGIFHTWRRPHTSCISNAERLPSNFVRLATLDIRVLYSQVDPTLKLQPRTPPGRWLTSPKEPKYNNGRDNEEHNLILRVNDILGAPDRRQYEVLAVLGKGTYGQVVKCRDLSSGKMVAVKVIKSHKAYLAQAKVEFEMYKKLKCIISQSELQPECFRLGASRLVHFIDVLGHENHICFVLELLYINLYELIRTNQHIGLSLTTVKVIISQLLEGLCFLQSHSLLHCDVKPENILLVNSNTANVKLVDFGSACTEGKTIHTYVQSRYYRSPEVVLGCQYDCHVDMWSTGCVAAELFLGLPLFPGSDDFNLLRRICEIVGDAPQEMLEKATNVDKYFNRAGGTWKMKTPEEIYDGKPPPYKRYFNYTTLEDIVTHMPGSHDHHEKRLFIEFLRELLQFDPSRRPSAKAALQHEFILYRHCEAQPDPGDTNAVSRKKLMEAQLLYAAEMNLRNRHRGSSDVHRTDGPIFNTPPHKVSVEVLSDKSSSTFTPMSASERDTSLQSSPATVERSGGFPE